jgi:hypothetical protein
MIPWLIRSLKRLLVFLAGIVVVYLAVWKFFPFFDHRVPVAFALLATYLFTAYLFIPASIRLFRLFFIPTHIPLYCITPDGFASDPINIGIIGTREQIISAMKGSGWSMPDKKNLHSLLKVLNAIIRQRSYPNTPFSQLYLFGRKQDLGFALPIEGTSTNRHHVRFWACHLDGPEAFHEHVRFYRRFHRPVNKTDGRQLWVGAASKDIGLIPIRHNAQITHMIDPDTDAERDVIVNSLRASHKLEHTSTVKVGAPYEVRNRTIGGFLKSDGKMRICILKP